MNNPELYSRVNNLTHCNVKKLLDEFSEVIQWRNDDTDTALDIGCGSGDVTSKVLGAAMPQTFKCLKGVDKSLAMVQYANTHYKSSKVSFDQWDVTAELNTQIALQYNHIFSFYTLQWVQDQKRAFQNMYDLLQPGGDILVLFFVDHIFFPIYNKQLGNPKFAAATKNAESFISPYWNKNNADVLLKNLVETIGFVDVTTKIEEKQFSFPDADFFKNFVKAVHPLMDRVTGDLQNEMIEEFCSVCAVNSNEILNEKQFIITFKTITLYCKKI